MFFEVRDLSVSYGDVQVLWDVSMTADENETISLVGANGAGKTTLLNAISGVMAAKSGAIVMDGQDITKMPPDRRVKEMHIMQVPEGRKLFSGMTVEENLEMGAYLVNDKKQEKEDLEWVFSLFPELVKRRKSLGGNLSGGEQQMVAIGRALMGRPKLLLIDELSLGLAPVIVDRLVTAIEEIKNTGRTGIFMVEQDVYLGLQMSKRAYVMDIGSIVNSGDSEQLLNDPAIQKTYLGL